MPIEYKAEVNSDGLPHVGGVGNGLGYNSHTLYPDLTCDTEVEAVRAAKIANIAYKAGYEKAQWDIRQALGL